MLAGAILLLIVSLGASDPGEEPFTVQSARTGEVIDWKVISANGGTRSSTNFRLSGAAGQTAIGTRVSTNFLIKQGFLAGLSGGGGSPMPTIVSTSQAINELNVAVSADVEATFNIDMDPVTITTSSFIVHGSQTGLHSGTVSYSGPMRTATFDPSGDFAEGEVVTAILTTAVQSSTGVPLPESHVWSFTADAIGGTGTLETPSTYSTADGPNKIAAADLDNDGAMDLVTSNYNSNGVSVLMNNGDGTFGTHTDYAVGTGPLDLVLGDVSGDGKIDIITGDWNTDSVSVLINAGGGGFSHYQYQVDAMPFAVVAVDFDGDGDLDLATANGTSNSISVLFNNGDGSFAASDYYATGGYTNYLAAADLDRDGDIDLAVTLSSSVKVFQNDGAGMFIISGEFPVVNDATSILAADLDGDGNADLTTVSYVNDSVSVLLNTGPASFAPAVSYFSGENSYGLCASDLDDDGDLDISVVRHNAHEVSLLFNDGSGVLSAPVIYACSYSPRGVVSADFDNDHDMDLACSNRNSDDVAVFMNESGAPVPAIIATAQAPHEIGVAADAGIAATFSIDMDETTINGGSFIIHGTCSGMHAGTVSYDAPSRTATFTPAGNFTTGEVVTAILTTAIESSLGVPLPASYVWSFTIDVAGGGGDFVLDAGYSVDDSPYSICAADLNGDGHTDLATASYTGAPGISVLMGNGDGSFGTYAAYTATDDPVYIVAADFDADGDIDLATANNAANGFSVFLNNGDGTYASEVVYAAGESGRAICASDFNGDGHIDLAVSGHGTDVSIYLNDGAGGFALYARHGLTYLATSLTSGDFDSDGDVDLAAPMWASGEIAVLYNNGQGMFTQGIGYHAIANAIQYHVSTADFEGDGDLDLAVAAYAGADPVVTVLLNDGAGGFFAVDYPVSGGAWSVFSGDIDDDGDIDLAVGSGESDNVSILRNNGDGSFAAYVDYAAGTSASFLCGGDFNDDGSFDLAVLCSGEGETDDYVAILLNQAGYMCGDASGDMTIDIGDAVHLINYIFKSGPAPEPECVGDASGDAAVDIGDAVHLINYIFKGGPPPPDDCCP